ncbi:hypothetical protein [Mycobacterium parascrofulaceum]|uniref:hypothetical protein n=1 Tax=Mycobacterium parascrofulaceum TaxID=240125 RepID=UPI001427D5E0|nr:hypothetical protein [Mycobacterium parascrofulaceum]
MTIILPFDSQVPSSFPELAKPQLVSDDNLFWNEIDVGILFAYGDWQRILAISAQYPSVNYGGIASFADWWWSTASTAPWLYSQLTAQSVRHGKRADRAHVINTSMRTV